MKWTIAGFTSVNMTFERADGEKITLDVKPGVTVAELEERLSDRRNLPDTNWRNLPDTSGVLQDPQKLRETEEIIDAKGRAPGTHFDERVRWHNVRPLRRDLADAPFYVVEVDPVLLPNRAVVEELELNVV